MTDFYVRPLPSGATNTGDGTSYATAWLGLANVGWANLKDGDVLHICGKHQLASGEVFNVKTQKAAGAAEYPAVTITGANDNNDPGLITAADEGFVGVNRSNVTIRNLTIAGAARNALYIYGAVRNCKFIENRFIGTDVKTGGIVVVEANDGAYGGLTFEDNIFTGVSGYGVRWYADSKTNKGAGSELTDIAFKGNHFRDLVTLRAALELRTADVAPQNKMTNIVITGNTFENVEGICVEVSDTQSPYPSTSTSYGQFGHSKGVTITGNTFRDCTWVSGPAPGLGGAIGVSGFDKYKDAPNRISGNVIRNVSGLGGGIDVFWGTYEITDNVIDTIRAQFGQIDGTAIIFDTGTKGALATRNVIRNVLGDERATRADDMNSGSGFTILQAEDVAVFGNTVEGCRVGVAFGNPVLHAEKGTTPVLGGQSASVVNNTFVNCRHAGVFVAALDEKINNNVCRNNVFTMATSAAYSVYRFGTAAWADDRFSHNVFYAGADPKGYAYKKNIDIRTDPYLDLGLRPKPAFLSLRGSPCIGAGANVVAQLPEVWRTAYRDAAGKPFKPTPSIGAFEFVI